MPPKCRSRKYRSVSILCTGKRKPSYVSRNQGYSVCMKRREASSVHSYTPVSRTPSDAWRRAHLVLPRRVQREAALAQRGPVGRQRLVARRVPVVKDLVYDARHGAHARRPRARRGVPVCKGDLVLRQRDSGVAAEDAPGRGGGSRGAAEQQHGEAGADEADDKAADPRVCTRHRRDNGEARRRCRVSVSGHAAIKSADRGKAKAAVASPFEPCRAFKSSHDALNPRHGLPR